MPIKYLKINRASTIQTQLSLPRDDAKLYDLHPFIGDHSQYVNFYAHVHVCMCIYVYM